MALKATKFIRDKRAAVRRVTMRRWTTGIGLECDDLNVCLLACHDDVSKIWLGFLHRAGCAVICLQSFLYAFEQADVARAGIGRECVTTACELHQVIREAGLAELRFQYDLLA